MDAYAAWLKVCDWLAAVATEGMMHDDFPDFDWLEAYEWGDHPAVAVKACLSTCTFAGGYGTVATDERTSHD